MGRCIEVEENKVILSLDKNIEMMKIADKTTKELYEDIKRFISRE